LEARSQLWYWGTTKETYARRDECGESIFDPIVPDSSGLGREYLEGKRWVNRPKNLAKRSRPMGRVTQGAVKSLSCREGIRLILSCPAYR